MNEKKNASEIVYLLLSCQYINDLYIKFDQFW